MRRRKIVYDYWRNPFDIANEWVTEEDAELPAAESLFDDNYHKKNIRVRPCIPTINGPIPISPYADFNKMFQFWKATTNFDVDEDVEKAVEEVDGVESLDVLSRYSFRFSVGRLFDHKEVKRNIEEVLDAVPPKPGEINPDVIKLPPELRQKVELIEHSVKADHDHWAIFVLLNGEIDVAASNSKEGHDMHVDLYKRAQELAGGVIFTGGK